jgi:hypothetical protein
MPHPDSGPAGGRPATVGVDQVRLSSSLGKWWKGRNQYPRRIAMVFKENFKPREFSYQQKYQRTLLDQRGRN